MLSNVNVLVRCLLTRASDVPRNNLVIERVDLRWDRCAIRRAPCSFMSTPTQSQTGELEKVLRVLTSRRSTHRREALSRGFARRVRRTRSGGRGRCVPRARGTRSTEPDAKRCRANCQRNGIKWPIGKKCARAIDESGLVNVIPTSQVRVRDPTQPRAGGWRATNDVVSKPNETNEK